MTDDLDPRQENTPEPEADAAVDAPPSPIGTGDDELEAKAADDFFHDRPAATSARVFDPEGGGTGA